LEDAFLGQNRSRQRGSSAACGGGSAPECLAWTSACLRDFDRPFVLIESAPIAYQSVALADHPLNGQRFRHQVVTKALERFAYC
jgi:hypothetical protein